MTQRTSEAVTTFVIDAPADAGLGMSDEEKPRYMPENHILMLWNEHLEMPSDLLVDPLFVALVSRLPQPDEEWSVEQRAAWVRIFDSIADALYPMSIAKKVKEPEPRQKITRSITSASTSETVIEHIQEESAAADEEPENSIPGVDYQSTRAQIIKVLKDANGTMLTVKEIIQRGAFEHEQVVYSQVSHMTLRKGWLCRQETRGGHYAYQVNDDAEFPSYLLAELG